MTDHPSQPAPLLHWRTLHVRYLLATWLKDAGREVTVAELVRRLDAVGVRVPGRPSKVVSDLLRTEQVRGRAVRTGRGRYRYGSSTPSTERRMRREALRLVERELAVRRSHRFT